MPDLLAMLVIASVSTNVAHWLSGVSGALWYFPTRGWQRAIMVAWTICMVFTSLLYVLGLFPSEWLALLGPPGAVLLNAHSIDARQALRGSAARS